MLAMKSSPDVESYNDRTTETLIHCWWVCKLILTILKTVWQYLVKLNVCLLYDPLIPFLGVCPREPNICRITNLRVLGKSVIIISLTNF